MHQISLLSRTFSGSTWWREIAFIFTTRSAHRSKQLIVPRGFSKEVHAIMEKCQNFKGSFFWLWCDAIVTWCYCGITYKKCQRHEKLGLPRQINFTVAFQKQNILFGYIHWYIIEPSLEMNEMALKLDFLNNDKTFARVERVGENCSFTAPNSRRHIVAHKWSVSGMICQKILSTASFGPIHGVKSDVIS